MTLVLRIAAAVAAAAWCLVPAVIYAADDAATKTAAAEKAADLTAAEPDATTQGQVNVGGQHIAYTAIAGTITVGATDSQDAQLGPDGKPLPGTQLAASAPKDFADAPPVAR